MMKKKVMIVEDNKDLLESMDMLLSEYFEVTPAVDGEDAVEKLQDVKPDIVVSDIMMPRMDGYQLLKAIKENPEWKRIPIILLTALGQDDNLIQGYELGADDYLVKPIRAQVLISRINNILRKQEFLSKIYSIELDQKTALPVKDPALAMIDSLVVRKYKFKNFSIPDLAADMGMSYTKLEAIVKDKAGLTPVKYINEIKLVKANELLKNEDTPVKEIAFYLGFKSLSYFGKCYKNKYGSTPSLKKLDK
jgi:DNA-binding response OmpR family regulator